MEKLAKCKFNGGGALNSPFKKVSSQDDGELFFDIEKQRTNHLFSWGFTLVELLAVIAILAIILLIAVPTILGIIDQSKQDAFKDSTLSIFKAAEMKAVSEGKYSGNVSELSLNNNKFLTGKWTYNKDDNTIVLTQVCDGNYKVDVVVSNNGNMTLNKDNGTCGFEIAIEGNNPDTVSCHASNNYIDQGASYGENKITSLDKVDLKYAGNYTLNYQYGSFKASRLVRVTNTNKPSIELSTSTVDVYVGDSFNANEYLTSAIDLCEGDIKAQVVSESTVIMDIPGEYNVTYKVANKGGVEEVKTLTVVVKALDTPSIVLPAVDGTNGWYKSSQTITVNYNKEVLNSYDYAISTDGGTNYSAWTNTTANTFALNENSGNIKVKVRGKRGSGYTIPTESTVIKMDTTIPTITAKSASSEVIVKQSKSVYDYFTINQDLGISGGTKECKVGSTTLTNTSTLASGTHSITCTITTTSGRTSNAATSLTVYNDTYVFDYTGGSQTFTVPVNGTYKVELWGASGAKQNDENGAGRGAYTSGMISLGKGKKLFVYVGSKGQYGYTFNAIEDALYILGFSGGGGSEWPNSIGGNAGGLIGETGYGVRYGDMNKFDIPSTGGTQTAGGTASDVILDSLSTSVGNSGHFGFQGYDTSSSDYGGMGGGGYYGGSSRNVAFAGGGGSSFISGHTGCVAVISETNQTPKTGCTTGTTDNKCAIHYSNYKFTNTTMIDGSGYNWTSVKENQVQMPKPDGTLYSIGSGHAGNGYAKITLISQ